MTNGQVAHVLQQIAAMLEFVEDEPFKAQAYRKAADAVAGLQSSAAELAENGKLDQVRGVGRSIGRVIEDLVRTGTSPIVDELEKKVPRELPRLLQIPGLGIKKVRRLHQELGIGTLQELEDACKGHNVQTLSGFGPKAEAQILAGIRPLQAMLDQYPLAVALLTAESLVDHLADWDVVSDVSVVGSVRRMRETVRNVNLVAASESEEEVLARFVRLPPVIETIKEEPGYCQVRMQIGRYSMPVDIRVVPPQQYGLAMIQFTGSKEHVASLEKQLRQVRVKQTDFVSEEQFYQALGLSWIPPELREGRGEVEAAIEHRLPKLIELADIRGDLHLHTAWSDGTDSMREMAEFARSLGYEYMAVTDHSRSLAIARGLSFDQLKRQQEEIRHLNALWSDFHIFSGIEMDILPDGSLDYPDDILKELDFVIGSIHSSFRQTEETMTSRIISAIQNPYVHMIAHPTGRLLTRRPGYALDLEKIFQTAAAGEIFEFKTGM